MTNIPNDKRSMDFGSAFAIQDPETMRLLRNRYDFTDLNSDSIIDEFLYEYDKWIKSGTLNVFTGLEDFEYKVYSNGTTEAFDKFYMKNAKRRFRCFKGEYMYHKLAWRDKFVWNYIEDAPLHKADAVVVSLPFADTGDKHAEYHNLMRKCSDMNIPVLIDCAYYGACRHIHIDLAYPCITDVTFSLSKTFPVAYARIGMRYTRVDDDDTMFVYHKISYNNKIGALIGLEYFKNFSPDYIPNKYLDKQQDFCNTLGIETSKTVLFGIDYLKQYEQYNRGGPSNRLSFHKQYIKGLDIASTK
tara:strand:- start:309 stop:1211 length:903 start_codon:yes stop_codon:yes gene_type:complete